MVIKKLIALLLTVVMVVPFVSFNCSADTGDVYINGQFFEGIRQKVQNDPNINPDGDGVLTVAERNAVTKIEWNLDDFDYDCFSTGGLGIFPNLEELKIINSKTIHYLDIRGCDNLKKLVVYGNSGFSKVMYDKSMPNLEYIDLSSATKITRFYSDAFPNLKYLNLAGSGVTAVNVINNPYLKDAYINNTRALTDPYTIYEHDGNQLVLNLSYTVVTSLNEGDVLINTTNFPAAVMFERAQSADLNKDYVLSLSERDNPINLVFANGCSSFKGAEYFNHVTGFGNQGVIRDFDYTTLHELTILRLLSAKISMIDLSGFPNLQKLSLSQNPISSINLSMAPNLVSLDLGNTDLKSVDVSCCPNLYYLDIAGTDIKVLDISNNPELIAVYTSPSKVSTTAGYTEYRGRWVQSTEYCTLRVPNDIQINTEGSVDIPGTSGVDAFVDRLYSEVLGRKPDANRVDWVNILQEKKSDGLGVALGFFNSSEFESKNKTDVEFVNICYKTFFNRIPDKEGLATWISALDAGMSREDVVKGFANSREWVVICWQFDINSGCTGVPDTTGVTYDNQTAHAMQFVDKLYSDVLGRTGDPAGVITWTVLLKKKEFSGAQVAFGFFFSNEFMNRNLTDEEYVDTLYQVFLGRKGDSEGINTWIGLLSKGSARQEVFNGFTNSSEWASICGEYGIVPV